MLLLLLAVALAQPAGYADDTLCGECHREHAASYRHVGMAQSFYRPRPANLIEDFDAPPYFHEKSRQYFEMRRRGEDIVFRRWQRDESGAPVNVFEQIVDWILGSGHHARTYVYRAPGGELYQLPVNWYSATREWRMAPGYDRADHDGVTRRVRHECMFCHNAYPAVAKEPYSYWRSQTFPEELPVGIGCQRCHGPGARHAALALTGDVAKTRASIVNPARLDARRRNDVCYECHMQPAVELFGVRRFDRDIYSFRPGQLLNDYSPVLDVTDRDLSRADRFEINHHPYRLEQSKCFTASAGALSCLTCHNPHRKVSASDRAAHYRAACMTCHAKPHHATRDCTTCHMPVRRTQDVIHAVMTDHFIRRTPGGAELLAPIEEREADPVRVEFLYPDGAPTGAAGELLLLVPLVRARGGADGAAVRRLEQLIAEVKPKEVEPYFDLAMGQLRQRRFADLEKTTKTILERAPGDPRALEWLGVARAGQTGRRGEAIRLLEEALRRDPNRPDTEFNLGLFLAGDGRTREAITHYERALALRPNLTAAWIRLGEAQRECGDEAAARESFARALAIDPSNARARAASRE
ncbi:MAG TPA: tetratricopeptide repeat protein [Thermoanaerobaculia bacterium]|nr:tetratricopeptide repeat protein [Thermoanaerobaculia bacterium]